MPIDNPQSKWNNSFTKDGPDMGSRAIAQNESITPGNCLGQRPDPDTTVYGEMSFLKPVKTVWPNIK